MSARTRLTKLLTKGVPKPPLPHTTVPATQARDWNIVRGDRVMVIGRHPEAGKQGEVMKVLRSLDRVLVKGVAVASKSVKGNPERGIPGRVMQRERSIPYSQVALVDPVTNKPTRVVRKLLDDGTKVRVSKKSGSIIPRPAVLEYRKRPVNAVVTESDTAEEDAWEVTYVEPSYSS
jgi:large subunit ribosomal protein L24